MGAMQQMLLATGGLDTQAVSVGGTGTAGAQDRLRGFSTVNALGSISSGNSGLYGGAAITELYYDENTGNGIQTLKITGTLANSGWTTMTVGATAYARSAATFTQGGGSTQWQWTGLGGFPSNPFSAVATVTFVTFT